MDGTAIIHIHRVGIDALVNQSNGLRCKTLTYSLKDQVDKLVHTIQGRHMRLEIEDKSILLLSISLMYDISWFLYLSDIEPTTCVGLDSFWEMEWVIFREQYHTLYIISKSLRDEKGLRVPLL